MSVTIRRFSVSLLAAAAWAVTTGVAAAHAQGTVADRILRTASVNARTTWARIAGPQPRTVPGLAQYNDGLAKLNAGQFADALTPLQAAVRANPNNAIFHADLAAAHAGLERWDDAALELVLARQKQAENQWFTIELAAVKALRGQYGEAISNLDAAVAGDSSLVDSTLAEAGVAWGWRARRSAAVMAWANLATARYPGIAEPWLRLANLYQQQQDTARGIAAIQRYLALRPADLSGQFLYAVFLYNRHMYDSAYVYARGALADSALRDRAAEVLFGVGARTLGDTTPPDRSALTVDALTLAKANVAAPEMRQRVALFLGYAQLRRVQVLDGQAEQGRVCETAQQLDTLVTLAGVNLQEGIALDSARVAPIIERTIPQYRQRSAAMVSQYCANRRRP